MSDMYKVLIVDDEMLIRQGIRHILNWEQYGFQIVGEAPNGKEALGLIETLHPHIVLTDIVMPIMDGEELARVIKQRWPEIEVIILSSFSEFDYVRSTFQSGVSDYILKPHLESGMLLEVLNKTVLNIPLTRGDKIQISEEKSMIPFLEGMLSGFEIDMNPNIVQQWLPYPSYYLLATSIFKGTDETHTEQRQQQGAVVTTSLKALYPEMVMIELTNHRISGDPQLSLYLLNLNGVDSEQLPYSLKTLHPSSVSEDGTVMWVLSRSFNHWSELREAYQDSLLPLLQYRFFLWRDIALMPGELPNSTEEVKEFQLQVFTEGIRKFQFSEAFQQLRLQINEYSLYYRGDVFEFKSFIGNVIFNVIHVLSNVNHSLKTLEETKYTYFKMIDEAHHIDEISRLLESFQLQIEQSIRSAKDKQNGNPNMKLLLEYIAEHYSEPINLTEMAMLFHFNPSYLSSFFATHHHEGFKEHLNRLRVDKASELLRRGEIPISEISSMVGYGDHSYFCKVFKKSTGLSPSQYRRHYYEPKEMNTI